MNANSASHIFFYYGLTAVFVHSLLSYIFILKTKNNSDKKYKSNAFIYLRLAGIIVFGTIPFFYSLDYFLHTSYVLINNSQVTYILIFAIPLMAFVLLTNRKLAEKPSHNKHYPQININSKSKLYGNIILWILYILAYEFTFRGVLLFEAIKVWGIIWSIAMNIFIYAISHIPKGKFEALGAIPLGFIFCLISIITHSFWTAFLIHLTIAISNDVFCLRGKNNFLNPHLK